MDKAGKAINDAMSGSPFDLNQWSPSEAQEKIAEFTMKETERSKEISGVHQDTVAETASQSWEAVNAALKNAHETGVQMQLEAQERARGKEMAKQQEALVSKINMTQQPSAAARSSPGSGCHPGHDEVAHPGGCHK